MLEAPDRETSRRLGTATFALQQAVLRELLETGVSAISEGNFHASWFEPLPEARIVQVHLTAAPGVLRDRMLARAAGRHPVHRAVEAAAEAYERALAGDWAPLPLAGALIAVDTTEWPDLPALVDRVAAAVSAAGGG